MIVKRDVWTKQKCFEFGDDIAYSTSVVTSQAILIVTEKYARSTILNELYWTRFVMIGVGALKAGY